jgi:hypothetical protein
MNIWLPEDLRIYFILVRSVKNNWQRFLQWIYKGSVADPDLHHFGKLDLDPDPHQSGKLEALEGHFGALEGPHQSER